MAQRSRPEVARTGTMFAAADYLARKAGREKEAGKTEKLEGSGPWI
jgi:hypothetical protein